MHEASPCREEDIEETKITYDEKTDTTTYEGYIQTFDTLEQLGGNYSSVETRWGDGWIRNFVRPNTVDIPIGRKVIIKTHIEYGKGSDEEEEDNGDEEASEWRVIESAVLFKKR